MPVPRNGSAVEGRLKTGPTPQMNPRGCAGEKKNEARMSLTPNVAAPPATSGGWLTSGVITRAMRFHFGFRVNGTTGWMLRMKRVFLFGLTPFSQLN